MLRVQELYKHKFTDEVVEIIRLTFWQDIEAVVYKKKGTNKRHTKPLYVFKQTYEKL